MFTGAQDGRSLVQVGSGVYAFDLNPGAGGKVNPIFWIAGLVAAAVAAVIAFVVIGKKKKKAK